MISSNQVEEFLLSTSVTLDTLKADTVVKDAISRVGYVEQHLDDTIALHGSLAEFYRDLVVLRGEQKAQGISLKKEFDVSYQRFSHIFDICKAMFSANQSVISELGLEVSRGKPRIINFLPRAQRLYGTVVRKSAILDVITENVGMTAEFFNAELTAVNELETLYREHVRLQGENQRMTLDRNKKIKELRTKMKNLKSILKMTYENDNPQILERLGIFVRNQPKPKKTDEEPVDGTEPTTGTDPEPGTEPASGTEPDAGTSPDAGDSPDAGTSPDAGSETVDGDGAADQTVSNSGTAASAQVPATVLDNGRNTVR